MSCLVSVYDKKSEKYVKIYEVDSVVQATRGFVATFRSKNTVASILQDYPEDFDLYLLADVDLSKYKCDECIAVLDVPRCLITGVQAKAMALAIDGDKND